jgi:RNA polymerase sigma-70 factor, ECF subfamily
MDDDELIASLARGDDTALRPLFDRNAPWLAARLRKALPPDDVEDVLQETFLAVWKHAHTYRPQGAPGAWLWGIARNQAAQLLRRRGRPVAGPLDEAAAEWATGDDPAETAASRVALHAATAALGPPGDPVREVWRLLYVEDRPVAEVAELMGIPEGTVKSRAHRARRLLRAALAGSRGARSTEGGAR